MGSSSPLNFNFKIHTFGCKVNTYDSGLLQKKLHNQGWAANDVRPQVHILNTCAVTGEATNEAVRQARRIKKLDPQAMVVVTGCAAQVDTEKFSILPEVDVIVANSHKGQMVEILQRYFLHNHFLNGHTLRNDHSERIFKSNIFFKEDLEEGGGVEPEHTRSFLKIQDGCNSFCTYCVIPFGRGKSRSISVRQLVERINELQASGVREVALTGVHIGDYCDDSNGKKLGLEDLIEQILLHTTMPRLRLSSLEPVELSERLLDFYQDPRLCRHFHMSIQSAADKTLSAMKRQYSARDVEHSLQRIAERCPGAFVGMDVIAGFCGESAQDFSETFARLQSLPWTRMHVFPYSERPGTKARYLPHKVGPAEIKRRAQELRELSLQRIRMTAVKQLGQFKQVLLLKSPIAQEYQLGLSRDFWRVAIHSQNVAEGGSEVTVEIVGYDQARSASVDGVLIGVPVGVV